MEISVKIRKVCDKDKGVLEKIAKEILEPLYGNQDKALREWVTGAGFKHAFVITEDKKVSGLLSLKANPNKSYLKISTLVILEEFRGRGFGNLLLDKAEIFSKEKGYCEIIVTVSDKKISAFNFFKKHGFSLIAEKVGAYKENSKEFILKKEVKH